MKLNENEPVTLPTQTSRSAVDELDEYCRNKESHSTAFICNLSNVSADCAVLKCCVVNLMNFYFLQC